MERGESIVCLGKLFNHVHAGWARDQDYPPKRLMTVSVEAGPYKGERLEKAFWDVMLDEYYQLHGWDKKSGQITGECLRKQGLSDLLPLFRP